jgi:hypothetical protein
VINHQSYFYFYTAVMKCCLFESSRFTVEIKMLQTPLVLLRKTDLGTFEMQKFDGILDNCPDELYQEFLYKQASKSRHCPTHSSF